jgi:hypothetical protein
MDDAIKKLSPKERMKKLKELQDKDKKEIEEAEAMIKQSQHDAEQEEIDEVVRRIKTPELKQINVEDLFREGGEEKEKDDGSQRRKKESMDEKLKGVQPEKEKDTAINERINQYGLAREETYDKVKALVEKAYTGAISEQERENLDFYREQFKDVNPGYMHGKEKAVVERTEELFDRLKRYH